jgi:hypothetical protein
LIGLFFGYFFLIGASAFENNWLIPSFFVMLEQVVEIENVQWLEGLGLDSRPCCVACSGWIGLDEKKSANLKNLKKILFRPIKISNRKISFINNVH